MGEERKANIEIVVAVMNTLANLHFPVSAILNGDEAINSIVGCCRALNGFVQDFRAEKEQEATAAIACRADDSEPNEAEKEDET